MSSKHTTSANQKRKYEVYKSTHQREKNKIKTIKRHLTDHPNNSKMIERIKELEALIT